MAKREKKTPTEHIRPAEMAMPAEELRRHYERSLELQRREVEALEQLVYLLDHLPARPLQPVGNHVQNARSREGLRCFLKFHREVDKFAADYAESHSLHRQGDAACDGWIRGVSGRSARCP